MVVGLPAVDDELGLGAYPGRIVGPHLQVIPDQSPRRVPEEQESFNYENPE